MNPDALPLSLLQIGYLVDLGVSIPIVWISLLGKEASTRWLFGENLAATQQTLRTLLGALWAALLVCLLAGVVFPVIMSPILVFQLIYKSLWILCFAVPRWLRGRGQEVPWKMAGIFLAFIVSYPWLIPWARLFVAKDFLW